MARRQSRVGYETSRRWTAREGQEAVTAWKASGLSVQRYAQQAGVDAQRLYRWRQRLEKSGSREVRDEPAPTFIEIGRSEVGCAEAATIELVLRSGRVLRTAETIDTGVLLRLVRALEEDAPC